MEASDRTFDQYKHRNLQKLSDALDIKRVDTDVISLLDRINADDRFVTTSSCAGRIVVLEVPDLGDKKQAVFHGRWHHVPEPSEVLYTLKQYGTGQLWFLAQPPIFHIAARDLSSANLMLQAGVDAGFKHSGIKTIQHHCIVELLSTERIDMPLGNDGTIYYDKRLILFLLETAEKVINRSKEKLNRLDKTLQVYLQK